MSGSKLLRLCSLFLCLLLCLANFSVVANAAEAEENLVDSDLLTWNDLSSIYPDIEPFQVFRLSKTSNVQYYQIGWDKPQYATLLSSNAIYTLPNLYVGDTYTLKLLVNATQEISLTDATWFIGIGYIDPSTNEPIAYEDNYIILTTENMQGAIGYYYKTDYYKEITFKYTHKENLGQPCIFIQGTLIDNSVVSSSVTINILYNSVSLTRDPSETEKKLDGILGWLADIKDSIVGLPTTIKTNFQTFFTDLQGSITTMKDSITDKLGTISTDFSGYITGLGETVSGFFTDLWNKFSAFFEKFKPRINVDFNFKSGALNTSTGEFEYPAGNSYVLSDVIYVPEGVEMHLNYTTINSVGLKYIPVTSEGEYSGRYDQYFSDFELLLNTSRYFRIETRSYAIGGLEGYVDVGWFTYFTYTLRHKIDIKIEEIKTSIHDFFVPPEGFFEEWKITFDLMLSDNLGFIYQAPNFVIDIVEVVQEILQSDQEVNLVFPAVEFDIAGYHIELFKDTKVDFSFLEAGIWFTLYSMYKVMLYVIFALALIKYGMSTWERTMAN